MDGDGQNYSVFNSRMLVDTVGDITDDALKASRIKDVIGVPVSYTHLTLPTIYSV